jgi:ADP-heptose:LPS heptosyltransferase
VNKGSWHIFRKSAEPGTGIAVHGIEFGNRFEKSMTFRQRILLDRLVAIPLCLACDALARVIGWILRRDHSITPETTHQIVVAKLVGMGSILQATPLLRALKQRFPKARVTFLTLEGNRCLVERLENVDEVLCLDDRGALVMFWTTLTTLFSLIRRRVDHYFDLEIYSGFASLLALFSLARNRLGFYRHSNRAKKGNFTLLVYFNTRMPVRRTYLQLGRVAGVPIGSDDRLGTIRIHPEDRLSLQQKLSALGLETGSRYTLVNPNASDLLIERRWPEGHVLQALTHLATNGHKVVLLGSPSEAPFVQSLHSRLPEPVRERVFNTAGRLTLGEAFALIEGAACVLTNDTGPMHMAFALGRPTVCLFGPVDPMHYGMDGPNIVTLYAPVPCSPCVHEIDEPPCRGNNVCMQRLMPELVVAQVLALLARDAKSAANTTQQNAGGIIRLPLVWDTDAGEPLGKMAREPQKHN